MPTPERPTEEYPLSEALETFEASCSSFQEALIGRATGETSQEELLLQKSNFIATSTVFIEASLGGEDFIDAKTIETVIKISVGGHNLAFSGAAKAIGIPPSEWSFQHHAEITDRAATLAEICKITGTNFPSEIGILLNRFCNKDMELLHNLRAEMLPLNRLKAVGKETAIFANSMLVALAHRTLLKRRKP